MNLNDEIGGAAMLVEPVSEANNLGCYYSSGYSFGVSNLCNGVGCSSNYNCESNYCGDYGYC